MWSELIPKERLTYEKKKLFKYILTITVIILLNISKKFIHKIFR